MADIYGADAGVAKWRAAAAQVAAGDVAKHAAAVDAEARFPKEGMAALAKGGFFGLCLPTGVGGQGQGPAAFAAVAEELAKKCASTAMIYVMHVSAAKPIETSTTLKDKDATLKAIAAGKHLTTLAFSEKGSRSQFWAPMSKLEKAAGGYVTSAQKSWVTSAGAADSYVSSAQSPGGKPGEATLYLLPRGRAGVKVVGAFNGLGLRGNDSAPVAIEKAAVGEGDLLTAHGAGGQAMLEVVLPWFIIGTSAMANGLCLASTEATIGHLQGAGFEHTGQKLRDLPTLRARLAEMAVRTEQSRALLGFTLGSMAAPSPMTPLHALQTRMSALQTAVDVTDRAMQACGGAAFSRQLGVERAFRDARAGWVMAPTHDHLADFIGRALTGLPLF